LTGAASATTAGVTLVGVDCAVDARNTGVAIAVADASGCRLQGAQMAGTHRQLVTLVTQALAADGPAILALDAPLGWPQPLAPALADHHAGDPLDGTADELFRRMTDRLIQARLGKTPLDVGADRIARTALATLRTIAAIRHEANRPLPLLWAPPAAGEAGIIEVYPAATLRTLGMGERRYKRDADHDVRRAISARLADLLDVGEHGPTLADMPDCLDAALCVLAAWDFARDLCPAPDAAQQPRAQREGWIWVRERA